MKIGILTFNFAYNYGAVIQAWALRTYLASLGHKVQIVNYEPKRGFLPWWAVELIHWNRRRFLQHLKFRSFRRRYLTETHPVYDREELEQLQFDAIIVGSDQVWNVCYFTEAGGKFNQVYFLHGLPRNVRRVAYAASIGSGHWGECAWKDELLADVREFTSRSVRETFARNELIQFGINSVHVPDPTLLLERRKYDEQMPSSNDGSIYLFAYLLTELDAGRRVCSLAQKEFPHPVRFVALNVMENQDGMIPSPQAWLSLLRNARFVITDSFHGVALSIVFNVPFVALLKPGKPGANARIVELLERMKLRDRIVTPETLDCNIFHSRINWGRVNENVSRFRTVGESFLAEALHD